MALISSKCLFSIQFCRKLVLFAFAMVWLLGIYQIAHAQGGSCRSLFLSIEGRSQNNNLYDPRSAEFLEARNIDATKISFVVRLRHSEDLLSASISYGAEVSLKFLVRDEPIPLGKLFHGYVSPTTYPMTANRGTGLGSFSYLLLARYLYLEHYKILTSDLLVGAVSPEAERIWRRFELLGFAELKGVRYFFKKEVLRERRGWELIDQILKNELKKNPKPSLYDPRSKEFLEALQIDPFLIGLKVSEYSSTGITFFLVKYNKKALVEFQVSASEPYDTETNISYVSPTTSTISIVQAGYGSFSYLLLARYLYLKHREVLTSDELYSSVSDSAKKVWMRFMELGLAESNGKHYIFKKEVLDNPQGWEIVDDILYREVKVSKKWWRFWDKWK